MALVPLRRHSVNLNNEWPASYPICSNTPPVVGPTFEWLGKSLLQARAALTNKRCNLVGPQPINCDKLHWLLHLIGTPLGSEKSPTFSPRQPEVGRAPIWPASQPASTAKRESQINHRAKVLTCRDKPPQRAICEAAQLIDGPVGAGSGTPDDAGLASAPNA